jgi:hypothetical protein
MWVLEMFHPIYPYRNLTQIGMGSDFQFWLLFSFHVFSVCLFFFVFFINLIKLLQFF